MSTQMVFLTVKNVSVKSWTLLTLNSHHFGYVVVKRDHQPIFKLERIQLRKLHWLELLWIPYHTNVNDTLSMSTNCCRIGFLCKCISLSYCNSVLRSIIVIKRYHCHFLQVHDLPCLIWDSATVTENTYTLCMQVRGVHIVLHGSVLTKFRHSMGLDVACKPKHEVTVTKLGHSWQWQALKYSSDTI